ncbi:MAG TPA: hypothetical protein VFB50_12445 [Chloroflexota bacterium]|nr:hypothetical protein [Chloroflexota bacterium]
MNLKRFTQFAFGHDNVAPEVWVNPATIAYVEPRIVMRARTEVTDGTLIYFQQEAGVLAVREPIGHVVATLQSGKGGVCRDCYQVLPEAWMSVCDGCREHRHNGVDEDYEAMRA